MKNTHDNRTAIGRSLSLPRPSRIALDVPFSLMPSEDCLRELERIRWAQALAYLRLIENPILLD